MSGAKNHGETTLWGVEEIAEVRSLRHFQTLKNIHAIKYFEKCKRCVSPLVKTQKTFVGL